MGVCSEALARYEVGQRDWHLSIEQARDARKTTLGAYYRVSKVLSHYHAALNEVGVLYASARIHEGWKGSKIVVGEIRQKGAPLGGHSFAIVGYNQKGFYVQNSWGLTWGQNGLAVWLYEDWLENVRDAWAVRLAVSTPQIWHLGPSAKDDTELEEGLFSRKPNRAEIVGHFVHIDDGRFHDEGRYWSDLTTIRQTAELVAESDHYDHLLLYAHGGLNSVVASARRIAAMKVVFKKNRIYPFHFMYDTGLVEEIKDVVLRKKPQVYERTHSVSDISDRLIEQAVRKLGRAIWREMKRGAQSPFLNTMAGNETVHAFLDAFAESAAASKEIHIVGHSTGAILLAALLGALGQKRNPPVIKTCALMAPACTLETFRTVYLPLLDNNPQGLRIDDLTIYNLTDELERADTVTPFYRKSLLYLVSDSFEDKQKEQILGMQKFSESLEHNDRFRIEFSDGTQSEKTNTASTTHGGFDNDQFTMNAILKAILGGDPTHPFTDDSLRY